MQAKWLTPFLWRPESGSSGPGANQRTGGCWWKPSPVQRPLRLPAGGGGVSLRNVVVSYRVAGRERRGHCLRPKGRGVDAKSPEHDLAQATDVVERVPICPGLLVRLLGVQMFLSPRDGTFDYLLLGGETIPNREGFPPPLPL